MSLKLKRSLHVLNDFSVRDGAFVPPAKNLPSQEAAPPDVGDEIIDDVLRRQAEKLYFFRPSMFDGCDRANYFHYRMEKFHPQRQPPRLKKILEVGSAYHTTIQGWLADHPDWWFAPESRVYHRIRGAWVRGSCDGVLIRRADLYRFAIEIKSISHKQFLALTKAKKEHVRQAILYTRLQGLRWCVFIYIDKDSQNLKEFAVDMMSEENEAIWKGRLKRIRYLKKLVDQKRVPEFDAKTCNTAFCAFVDHCRSKGAPV